MSNQTPKPTRPSKPPVLQVHKMPDGKVMVGKQHSDKSKPLISLEIKPKKRRKIIVISKEERLARDAKKKADKEIQN